MMTVNATATTLPAHSIDEYPACRCVPSMPWARRMRELPSHIDPAIESRTCPDCSATTSIAFCDKCREIYREERAYFYITPTRGCGSDYVAYHACADHARSAAHYTYCEVENVEGEIVQFDEDGNEVSS